MDSDIPGVRFEKQAGHSFKFSIGEKVNHTGHKKNLVVRSCNYSVDHNSSGNYYDCFICDEDGMKVIEYVSEYWLKEGHVIE